jgi:glycerate 2-kinase
VIHLIVDSLHIRVAEVNDAETFPDRCAKSSMAALRDDARAIWRAAVEAVDSKRLVRQVVRVAETTLTVAGESIDLASIDRIAVVGAGKAGAGMAQGLEEALGHSLLDRVVGWINVPADCVRPLQRITLHAARPAGINEPTEEGVRGTHEILRIVSELGPNDLCLVLISGGGSALLPGPAAPVTLAEKQQLTRKLAAAGATIQELNTVRKQLSTVKGGRLAAQIGAGRTIVLIISDVIGDPLEMIASGPTVTDTATPTDAEAILRRRLADDEVPPSVWERLRTAGAPPVVPETVRNVVIGNNRTAVAAAVAEARRRGYDVKDIGSENAGEAAEWGRTLAEAALDARRRHPKRFCLVGGGETTVRLESSTRPQKGGRNQEIALAAVARLWNEPAHGIVVLSGGTDGEDGPTDAAGAIADVAVIGEARRRRLSPQEFLASHDSYWFFDATGGLIKTGPTHTNVMDVQVVLTEPRPKRPWVSTRERVALGLAPQRSDRLRPRTAKSARQG